jgi:hypothetical protein
LVYEATVAELAGTVGARVRVERRIRNGAEKVDVWECEVVNVLMFQKEDP